MKILVNNVHVKTVPKRFNRLDKLNSYFTDLDHKRLSRDERTNIEIALFIQDLPAGDRRLIGDSKPTIARHVIPREGDHYFSVVFGNKEFKCPKYIYSLIGKKQEIKRLY